jgi:alpha-beta hydrolase superfamily lysophospholipase
MKLFIAALAASAASFGANAMAAENPQIVLLHGAFENAQVWGHVTAKLQKDGYKVVTVDLPGWPGNPMSPDKVSLYRDTVVKALGASKHPNQGE